MKISFNVLDQCDTDTAAPSASAEVTGQAYPDTPNTYVNTAKLRLVGHGLGLRRRQEPRVPPGGFHRLVALLR